MFRNLIRNVLLAALLFSPGMIRAATVITSVPYTISASGEYELGSDLTTSAPTAITVTASNVVINLNGHRLRESQSAGSSGIFVAISPSIKNLTVSNGSITGFELAVVTEGVSQQILMENLTISNARAAIEVIGCKYGSIQNCSVVGSSGAQDGIDLITCTGINVQNNHVSACPNGISSAGGNGNGFIANYVDDADHGFLLNSSDKYRDNLTTNCPTPFTGGIAVGNDNG